MGLGGIHGLCVVGSLEERLRSDEFLERVGRDGRWGATR